MKVAYISFGLFDVSIPLVKYLSKEICVDYFIMLAQNKKREGSISVDYSLPNGLIDNRSKVKKIIGEKIVAYFSNKVNIKIFTYSDLKFQNPKNIYLSYSLGRYLRKHKYNVIHFNGNDLQQVWVSLFTSEIKKVHTIHDYESHEGEKSIWSERFNKLLMLSKRQIIVHHRLDVLKANKAKGKLNTIYYGPLETYKLWSKNNILEENNAILYFGRISPYKGIEYLIKAVKLVKKQIPEVKLIIAGEGKYYFDIRDIENNRTFEIINRYIPNDELVELIQKSKFVVCPYKDATQSGVIMHVYTFNKPIVSTAVGGIPEIVDDNETGKLVPPKDSKALAEAIIELLQNPEKLEKMKKNIEKKCSHGKLSWDFIAQQTIEVYRKAIKNT